MNVQTNYFNNNLLILDVKQLNKIMELYYFYTLKALWDVRVNLRCIMGCPGSRRGPAKWRVTVSGELRFMTSYLES